MATIYRFVIEQKGQGGGSNKPRASKGAAKKGRNIPLFGGSRGGVEHNRKMRAINPILNKVTFGAWEKGTRFARAAGGLFKVNDKTGKVSLGGPSIAIIIALVIMISWNILTKSQSRAREAAEKANTQNYKKLENGTSAIHTSYKVSVDWWSGKTTYNENK